MNPVLISQCLKDKFDSSTWCFADPVAVASGEINPFTSLAFYRRAPPSPSTAATCSRFPGKLPIAMVSMAGRDIPADFPLAGTPKYPPWTHRYSRFWRPNSADFIAPLPAHAEAVKSYRQAFCAFPQSTRVTGGCISAPGPVYRARVRAELYPRAPQLKETADVIGSTNSVPSTNFMLSSSTRELVARHRAPPPHAAPTGSSQRPL